LAKSAVSGHAQYINFDKNLVLTFGKRQRDHVFGTTQLTVNMVTPDELVIDPDLDAVIGSKRQNICPVAIRVDVCQRVTSNIIFRNI